MAEEIINFEKELKRLNEIVSLVQQDNISLDEGIKLYEEGNRIITSLEKALKEAEDKIEQVVAVNKK